MAMRIVGRERRKLRIRRKINGTQEKPRLTVFRSAKHIYAQVVDDVAGSTLAHASTLSRDVRGAINPEEDDKTGAAKKVGAAIAKLLLAKGIQKVVFDRNGYLYHGRVRALADAAREAGLKF
jgi:large subunit ribosomal protein L18